MRKLIILSLFLVLLIGQMVNAQTDKDIMEVLRDRVTVSKTNQSIVVAVANEKGTHFISYGKTAQTPNAKNADENTIFEIGSITKVFTGTLLAEAVKRGDIVWHNGGTGDFRSFAGFSKAKKMGIVVLSNSAESVDDIGFHFLNREIPLT
jgi:CubicO group peptidase (beta-lactamase class C family)